MSRPITLHFMTCFRILFEPILICLLCVPGLSCSTDHESETGSIFETEFIKNYRAITKHKSIKTNYLDGLTTLKTKNADAYRTIAFTWQNAANDICIPASPSSKIATPQSGYQQLLNTKHPQQTMPPDISEEIRSCWHKFYLENWAGINAMIKLNI